MSEALGPSPFNSADYTRWRFLHYHQQIVLVLRLRPTRVLEIGPGDHAVTDMLRRKGIEVETFDSDPHLHPTHLGDVRDGLPKGPFDVVLASEVFEHMPLSDLPAVLRTVAAVLAADGRLVMSVPYSTVRLFPRRPDYGRFVSPEGRLPLGVPLRWLYRLLPARSATIPPYPRDRVDVHHWDLGFEGSTRKRLRRLLSEVYTIEGEVARRDTNCVFWVLAPRARG